MIATIINMAMGRAKMLYFSVFNGCKENICLVALVRPHEGHGRWNIVFKGHFIFKYLEHKKSNIIANNINNIKLIFSFLVFKWISIGICVNWAC